MTTPSGRNATPVECGHSVQRAGVVSVAVLLLLGVAVGQVAERQAYDAAVHAPTPAARIAGLESFLSRFPHSGLQRNALTLLTWAYFRSASENSAATAANELLTVDRDNAVGLAVLSRRMRTKIEGGPHGDREIAQLRALAEHGVSGYAALRKPDGLTDLEFYEMQRAVLPLLESAVGYAALQQKDYGTAQMYLRQALAAEPSNGANAYALALADLDAKDGNASEGFWWLARTVNLAEGTPAQPALAQYAAQRYQVAGGSASDWKRYLFSARGESAPAFVIAAGAASARQAARRTAAGNQTTPEKDPARSEGNRTAKATPPRSNKHITVAADERLPESVRPPSLPPPRRAPLPRTSGPLSLGVLVEASGVSRAARKQMVQGLSEMVDNLRAGDEAFILSFSREVIFEQDLTKDRLDLERALDNIKPEGGTALFDAIEVAAGHLGRIARNANRVLLIVSDGHDTSSHTGALQLASSVQQVRIYCIGVGVGSEQDRRLLQALASRSGGQASFVGDMGQFDSASEAMARVIYGAGM